MDRSTGITFKTSKHMDMNRLHVVALSGFAIASLMIATYQSGYDNGKKLTLGNSATLPDSAFVLVSGKLPFSPEVEALQEYTNYSSAVIVEEISLVGSNVNPNKIYATYKVLLKSKKS